MGYWPHTPSPYNKPKPNKQNQQNNPALIQQTVAGGFSCRGGAGFVSEPFDQRGGSSLGVLLDPPLESQRSLEPIAASTEAGVASPYPVATSNWAPLRPTRLILKEKNEKIGTRREIDTRCREREIRGEEE